MKHSALYLVMAAVLFMACAQTKSVERIDPETTTDLSGKWNDTDARLVAEEMITDALTKPWLNQHALNKQKSPVVIVGTVRNESMEHIDTEVFTKEIERAFVNSGSVSMVASRDERAEVREERLDQQENASFETTKKLAKELGADYMMIGNINSIQDEGTNGRKIGKKKYIAVFYTVNLELVNVESNQKVWIGNKKIKKWIEIKNYKS